MLLCWRFNRLHRETLNKTEPELSIVKLQLTGVYTSWDEGGRGDREKRSKRS